MKTVLATMGCWHLAEVSRIEGYDYQIACASCEYVLDEGTRPFMEMVFATVLDIQCRSCRWTAIFIDEGRGRDMTTAELRTAVKELRRAP